MLVKDKNTYIGTGVNWTTDLYAKVLWITDNGRQINEMGQRSWVWWLSHSGEVHMGPGDVI